MTRALACEAGTVGRWANLLLARHSWPAAAERVVTGLNLQQTGRAVNRVKP
jgi:hypothetical protein